MKIAISLIIMLFIVGHSLRFHGKRAVQSILRPSVQHFSLSFSTSSGIDSDLDTMSLAELKEAFKSLGGKSGSLRKAEIAAEIRKLQSGKSSLPPAPQLVPAVKEQQPQEKVQKEKANLSNVAGLLQQTNMVSRKSIPAAALAADKEEEVVEEVKAPTEQQSVTATAKPTRHPVGSRRDERLADIATNSEMELTFLGTASCIPTATRGVSCVAMRYNSDIWLFDCGESSQVQLQSSRIGMSKIKKIFITHSHGDHFFGLPGVLCLLGQSNQQKETAALAADEDNIATIIDIYGPEGTRDYIRACMQLTYSRITVAYRVHELKRIPYLHAKFQRQSPTNPVLTKYDKRYGEREGGRDIFPDASGIYHLLDEDMLSVQAAPMQHTVPCVGYVVTEKEREGGLRVDLVSDLVEKHKVDLRKLPDLKGMYKRAFAMLKSLKPGETFTFPDGTTVDGGEINDPPKVGRKFVYMGDTCNGQYIQPLCYDADVVVHEATNSFNPITDRSSKHSSYKSLEYDTIAHGHSTPQMAARFAEKVRAKKLILTHFSGRYPGDSAEASMKYMWFIEDQARRECARLTGENDIIAAWDLMCLGIPTPVSLLSSKKALADEEVPSNDVVNASRGYDKRNKPETIPTAAAAKAVSGDATITPKKVWKPKEKRGNLAPQS